MNFGEREKRDWGHPRAHASVSVHLFVSSSRTISMASGRHHLTGYPPLAPPIHTIESHSILVSVSALEELELLFNVTEGDCRGTSDSFIGVDVVSNLGSVSLVSVTLSSSTANA